MERAETYGFGKGKTCLLYTSAVFRTAFQHQHQVAAQGGTEKVKYYVSGGMMDQDGTIIGSCLLYTSNDEEILTIPLDGTRIERSIHHDALHEIRCV